MLDLAGLAAWCCPQAAMSNGGQLDFVDQLRH
jgi:hypothetical protein